MVNSMKSFEAGTRAASSLPAGPQLTDLIADVGVPCWAWGQTAAALHHFDDFAFGPHFDVVIERGHNVRRIGHAIHPSTYLPLVDRARPHGVPASSATRTLITIAQTHRADLVTGALDGAIRRADHRGLLASTHRRRAQVRATRHPRHSRDHRRSGGDTWWAELVGT